MGGGGGERGDTGARGILMVAATAENCLAGPRKIKHKHMTKQFPF